ncbi:MAG: GlsB/YeaQ/YmgE family stress response membrane protein [Akkermansiaceae bacterium]|jgi:uncharacterized membrane protein YeaQ/YmgE (transglycosylase-associated protein family)|nr:GlsB/YeaQ/YmgE family stress response membrane protein [Akkermansiaceae bacterium]
MGIISWILLGLVAGALAKFIMPGKDPGGCLVTIVLGVVGAMVGGFLGTFVGLGKIESFDLGGIFIATVGAIVVLVIWRLIQKKK